ncbi:MAG: hypothetical protein ACTSU5_18585, partial [Promethearchaeota archaeon]
MGLSQDNRQALALEAMDLLETAEKLEGQEEWGKACFAYQDAAEKLARSRLVEREKIDQIYDRITEIQKFLSTKGAAGGAGGVGDESQVTPEELSDQAFSFLDSAKEAEKRGEYQQAIDDFMQAATLMTQAGWEASQVQGIQTEVERVQKKLAVQAAAAAAPPAPDGSGMSTAQATSTSAGADFWVASPAPEPP